MHDSVPSPARPRRGPVGWKRRALLVGALPAAAAVAVATQAVAPAAAFDGPRGHHQFVLVDTDGAPLWKAEMWLYDGDTEVYHWHWPNSPGLTWASSGKVTWWYTSGATGRIRLTVHTMVDNPSHTHYLEEWIEPTDDPGHCVAIAPMGGIERFTGSGQGCTPD